MMIAPDPLDLLGFFGVEPAIASPEEGFYAFEVDLGHDETLRLSFDRSEGSVQIVMKQGGEPISIVSQEGATQMSIIRKDGQESLVVEFSLGLGEGRLVLTLASKPHVYWSTLLIRQD